MGILSTIFGGPKAIGKIVDAARSGIDALTYTEEEKAVDAAKQREKARDQVIAYMEATQSQNVARRFIAIIIIGIWATCYVVSLAMIVASIFIDSSVLAEHLMEGSKTIDSHISDIETEMLLVLAFYFGAPHLEPILGAIVDRRLKGKSK